MLTPPLLKPRSAAAATVLGAMLAAVAATAAEPYQSHESIRAAAQTAAEQSSAVDAASGATSSVKVGELDPRLRLPACTEEIEGFLPTGSPTRANLTVGVRCTGATPWTVYVPVRISTIRPVVILSRPLNRGSVIGLQDLDIDLREIGASSAYFDNPNDVIGKVLTRTGTAGQVVIPGHLAAGIAVKRGQQVVLVANSGGILVRGGGTAMTDAGVGDRLKVKNNSSARVVEGTVLADGSVDVGL